MIRLAPIEADPLNIILAGVGGQGNILISKMLAGAATIQGLYTMVGETYGVSQRGGAVLSHVRISPTFECGPLVPLGEAHVIVGLEPLETARMARNYGNRQTRLLVNSRPIYPISVSSGEKNYPSFDNILTYLNALAWDVKVIPGVELASGLGVPKAMNVVMFGALAASGWLPVSVEAFRHSLEGAFHGEVLNLNKDAFDAGLKAVNDLS